MEYAEGARPVSEACFYEICCICDPTGGDDGCMHSCHEPRD